MLFNKNSKFNTNNLNRGMTYVELVVVLSIFAGLTAVVMFSYSAFQAKVDIKNLGSDIALKIIEAQKSSVNGTLPPTSQQLLVSTIWKPSYGIYFNMNSGTNTSNKIFYYFADVNQDKRFDESFSSCPNSECMDKITITNGQVISELKVFFQNPNTIPLIVNQAHITFTRPNAGATLVVNSDVVPLSGVSYIQVTVVSTTVAQNAPSAKIKIYASGRIEVN